MPFLQIFTTLSRTQIPENLGALAAEILSTTLRNKPVERIAVHVCTDQQIFSGSASNTKEPSAYAVLRSIGSVDLDDNRRTLNEMTKFFHTKMGIEPSQFRMIFHNQSPDTIGVGGKMYVDILGAPKC